MTRESLFAELLRTMSRPSDPNAKIKLLTAAEAEFVDCGLDRAKVENITARAGLSKGAFYLHFPSKEDAFRQLVETTLARLARFIDAIPLEEAAIPFDDIGGFLEFWVEKDIEIFEFVWQNRGVMGLLLEGGSSADYRYLMDEFAERSSRAIALSLALGAKLGLYRADLDIELASVFIAGAYDRYARQVVRATKRPDFPSVLGKLQTMVIRGIGSEVVLAHTATDTPATNFVPADSPVSDDMPARRPRRGPARASRSGGR